LKEPESFEVLHKIKKKIFDYVNYSDSVQHQQQQAENEAGEFINENELDMFILEKEEKNLNLNQSNIEGFFIPESNSQVKANESALQITKPSQTTPLNIANDNNVKELLRNKLLSKKIQKEEKKIPATSKLMKNK
jgi:hypothetical protein